MLAEVLGIQGEVNRLVGAMGQEEVVLMNEEELGRIRELIAAKTYPDKWDGTEPLGDVLQPKIYSDGWVQPLLFEEA